MSTLEVLDEPSSLSAEQRAVVSADAETAARLARVDVRVLDDLDELRLAAALFSRVWEMQMTNGDDPKVPLDLLRALSHAGSYVAGAWAGGSLVGASLGFARLDAPGPSLHSHITGVIPGAAGSGVGRALKLHQRCWALERGIHEIVWTFDPLVRRNAYFNVSKLGARIVGYYDNFYGPMPDGLNNRDESDRCLASWVLLDGRVRAAVAGTPEQSDAAAEPAVVLLDPECRLTTLNDAAHTGRARVWVPEDIVSLRRTDPPAAAAWRQAVRESLGVAIGGGWVVNRVGADGWFELDPPAPPARAVSPAQNGEAPK